MIRPITVATFLMACGSGLYLYQEKHEVQLLDRTIERTVHDTQSLRDQSRVLAAEWTMLNDPERLRQYADRYLSLKSIQPSQFTDLANLDSRLPPVPPPAEQAADPAVASAEGAEDAGDATSADELPRPPLPVAQAAEPAPAQEATVQHASAEAMVAAPQVQPAVKVSDHRTAVTEIRRPSESRSTGFRPSEAHAFEPRVADVRPAARAPEGRPPEQRLAEQHMPVQRLPEPRPVEPGTYGRRVVEARPIQQQRPAAPPVRMAAEHRGPYGVPRAAAPVAAAPTPVSVPYGGSLLGMARSAPPAPRPMPVNATNLYAN